MRTCRKGSSKGFTLIELMTAIATLGILSAMSIQSFKIYRENAHYTRAASALRNGEVAVHAALSTPDIVLPSVNMYSQVVAGEIADLSAREIVPGLVLPVDVRVRVYNDPTCSNGGCIAQFLQANPCHGTSYANWTRFGDGEEILITNLPGVGCPP